MGEGIVGINGIYGEGDRAVRGIHGKVRGGRTAGWTKGRLLSWPWRPKGSGKCKYKTCRSALVGENALEQGRIDRIIQKLADGTENKSKHWVPMQHLEYL